jgi:hypothetical protein
MHICADKIWQTCQLFLMTVNFAVSTIPSKHGGFLKQFITCGVVFQQVKFQEAKQEVINCKVLHEQ